MMKDRKMLEKLKEFFDRVKIIEMLKKRKRLIRVFYIWEYEVIVRSVLVKW